MVGFSFDRRLLTSLLVLLLIFLYYYANTYYLLKAKDVIHTQILNVTGESFGNNGNRFSSFINCVLDKHDSTKFFSGGSHLAISALILNETEAAESKAIGSWTLSFYPYEATGTVNKNGTFYKGEVSELDNGIRTFTLWGLEITDGICGSDSKDIIISGSCVETAPVYFSEPKGDSIGSKTPVDGENVYYFFGHDSMCS